MLGRAVLSLLASIPSPGTNVLEVGGLMIHLYGVFVALGIGAALMLTLRRWRKVGGRDDLVYEVLVWGVLAGLAGGRLYHLASSWSEVPDQWWGVFAVWEGGLSIWGAIAGGIGAAAIVVRRHGVPVARFFDAAAPALLVGQAIGRIGCYFNQELFGRPTNLPWALEIEPQHRPDGYEAYETFHPTFLYEIVWNFALFAALRWLERRFRPWPGVIFGLYVAGYSLLRVFIELLRVDPSAHLFGLRLNFYVAAALFLAASMFLVRLQRRGVLRPAT